MRPKERLKRLESYSVCDNYREKEEDFREIEKALEVLEVLKEKMTFETKYYNCNGGRELHEYIAYNGETLCINTKEEFYLLKEWLRND